MSLATVSQRFIERLHIRSVPGITARVDTIVPVNVPRDAGSVLELYHSVRDAQSFNDVRIQSILTNGFRVNRGNKGTGVYLSSHSRYALHWSGSPIVLVCHIGIKHASMLHRYRSELKSGQLEQFGHNGWEYVVSRGSWVRPAYLLKYSTQEKTNLWIDEVGYVPLGASGCSLCDLQRVRCDCQLHPPYDPNDLVVLSKD